jgi:hypothetical protein
LDFITGTELKKIKKENANGQEVCAFPFALPFIPLLYPLAYASRKLGSFQINISEVSSI